MVKRISWQIVVGLAAIATLLTASRAGAQFQGYYDSLNIF